MRSALFRDSTRRIVDFLTDVSGQHIVPIFRGQRLLRLSLLLHTVLATDHCHWHWDDFTSSWCGAKLSTGLTLK
jgi:hypothetical protein